MAHLNHITQINNHSIHEGRTTPIAPLKGAANFSKSLGWKVLFFGVILLAFGHSSAFANNSHQLVSNHPINKTSIILHLPSAAQSYSEVSLKDKFGLVLHHEIVEDGPEKKVFNLQNLPDGEYILLVRYGNTINWQHLFIQNRSLNVDEDVKTLVKPTIRLNGEHLDLNMLCFADQKVSVRIWDDAGHILAEEYFESTGDIQRRYNLKELEKGDYSISMSIPDVRVGFEFDYFFHWN